jgi:hypothetical protein
MMLLPKSENRRNNTKTERKKETPQNSRALRRQLDDSDEGSIVVARRLSLLAGLVSQTLHPLIPSNSHSISREEIKTR